MTEKKYKHDVFWSIFKIKSSKVGIYVLTDRGCISRKKEPIQDDSNLSYSSVFKILRKNEYENILKQCYGELPQVSQVAYYNECFKMFSLIPISHAYLLAIQQLKKRNKTKIESFTDVPYELKSLMYFSCPTEHEWNRIKTFLSTTYKGE